MDREKFQQKAPKPAKQKKSKSAEFLMVTEDREAVEGVGNPAFHTSSPDLSAYQAPEKEVIRPAVLDHALAARQQEFRLLASAGPQARLQADSGSLCDDSLMRLFRENGQGRGQGEGVEEPLSSEEPMSSRKSVGLHKENDGTTSACNKEFNRYAQKDVMWLRSSSLKQDLKFEGEELNQYIPMSCLKTDKTVEKAPSHPLTADRNVRQEDSAALPGAAGEGRHESEGSAGPPWQVELAQPPQPVRIEMKCVRGLKNKAPRGSYLLRVSLLRRPGGRVLQWPPARHLQTSTRPGTHAGNFYDVGLYFHENLQVVLPPKKDVKPGMAFLFELFLLRGTYASCDCVVGWSAFPLCDNNFDIVEGKFKCPLLRGHYDRKLNNFRKIEDLICLDLDHWLCNLYFQVIKLPLCLDDQKAHVRHTQLPPEFPVCLMTEVEKTEAGVENTTELSGEEKEQTICASINNKAKSSLHSSQGGIFNKISSCPTDCDGYLLKEDQELHNKREDLADHFVEENTTAWRTGDIKDYSQDTSYLEELEKHRFSVCRPPGAGAGGLAKHLGFALVSVCADLRLAQWRGQGFWYVILLAASLWFLRLHLHYLSQWLVLQAISAPVTRLHFSALTAELCYPPSALGIGEELLVVAAGPLALSALTLPLVLLRWGCELRFACCPEVLSTVITALGLWTVLDPLAVFIVDTVLGRLTGNGVDTPVADAAKLYWAFVRTAQSGLLGVAVTVFIYAALFVISSLIFYVYGLRDMEIFGQQNTFFSCPENKVAVYDYVWENHGVQAGIASCDLRHPHGRSVPALGPGDTASHVSVYTVYPSGFRELHRHFLRLPGGAMIEVFGVISGLTFIPSEVATAIQEHMSEMDSTLEDSFDVPARDMKRIP